MLTAYIDAAMRHAHYEIMENGRFWGDIPQCEGLWGEGPSLEEARLELKSALESWLLIGFQFGDRIPIIDGIDLNMQGRNAKGATVGKRVAAAKVPRTRRTAVHV